MSEPDFDYDDDYASECGNCGGEGFTYNCIDGCCVDAEEGCELCASRCDWCNARPKRQAPSELQQVLADALAKVKP